MDLVLVVGTLDPVAIHIDASAGPRDAAGFAAALNAKLHTIAVDPTLLGLSASHAAIHLDDLVSASKTTVNIGTAAAPNVVDALQLTTTMYNEVSIESPYSKQRSAARWACRCSPSTPR